MWLFFATFHADIVFGLAGLSSIVFCAGLLLLAALLAAVRLFGLHRCGATKEQQHDHSSDGSHDDLLSMQTTDTALRQSLTRKTFAGN
jgi:hypothetical protein